MNEDPDRLNILERIPRRRSPERDLWPGIHARLAPRRSRHAWGQFALAASLVAGFAAMVGVGLRDAGPAAGTTVAGAALKLNHPNRAIVEANLSIVEQAEQQLQQALRKAPDSDSLRSLLESTQHRARDLRALL